MYQLDKTKIEDALKSLGNAGKNAVATLNKMTDGEFKGSPMETDPLNNLSLIVRTLASAWAKAEVNAQYAGMSVEEISQAQEAERAADQRAIKEKFNAKLAARAPRPAEPEPDAEVGESEPEGGQDTDPNDPPQV